MATAGLPSTDTALCFGLSLCGSHCPLRLQVTRSQNRNSLDNRYIPGKVRRQTTHSGFCRTYCDAFLEIMYV